MYVRVDIYSTLPDGFKCRTLTADGRRELHPVGSISGVLSNIWKIRSDAPRAWCMSVLMN